MTLRIRLENKYFVIGLWRGKVRSLLSKLHFAAPAINRNVVTEKGHRQRIPKYSSFVWNDVAS